MKTLTRIPTAELSDNKLIKNIKSFGCDESYRELCKRCENIFYRICHRYRVGLQKVGLDIQDIFDERDSIILTCAKNFKAGKKTKFSTYVGNYARYLCLTSINKRKRLVDPESEDIKNFLENREQFTLHDSNESGLIENVAHYFNGILNPRFKKVLELRYYTDKPMSWKEISKEMNISVQTAISIHNNAIKSLKNKIKTKNNI